MGAENWHLPTRSVSDLRIGLRLLFLWLTMVQRAGIDLLDYGAREKKTWNTLGFNQFLHWYWLRIAGLVYGSKILQWSIKIRYCNLVSVRRLHRPPGAFQQYAVTETIIWTPSRAEEDEGYWKVVKVHDVVTKDINLEEVTIDKRSAFVFLVDKTQDDSAEIMTMAMAMTNRKSRPRFSSQPPSLRRSVFDHCISQESRKHKWLTSFHLCPSDFEWKIDCCSDHSSPKLVGPSRRYIRSCCRGQLDDDNCL